MIIIEEFKNDKENVELVPAPELEWHAFSDGCVHINYPTKWSAVGRRFVVTVKSGHPGDLVTANLAIDLIKRLGGEVILFCPYVPGARQDKGLPRTAEFTKSLLCEADHVICVDVHSSASVPDHALNIEAVELVPDEFITPATGIIAPDAGAVARATAVAKRFNLPLFVARKKRDTEGRGAILEYECPEITTEKALVVDDICDGGGTFLALADAIKMPSEKLTLWTTHGIYSRGLFILKDRFSKIACTDSFSYSSILLNQVYLRPFLLNYVKDIFQ